jgi:hypothetical protein
MCVGAGAAGGSSANTPPPGISLRPGKTIPTDIAGSTRYPQAAPPAAPEEGGYSIGPIGLLTTLATLVFAPPIGIGLALSGAARVADTVLGTEPVVTIPMPDFLPDFSSAGTAVKISSDERAEQGQRSSDAVTSSRVAASKKPPASPKAPSILSPAVDTLGEPVSLTAGLAIPSQQRQPRGRRSTILSGPQGLLYPPILGKPTLGA